MILRSGNTNVVNIPHKYWEKLGWKLNDDVEVKCDEESITIIKKK
jgi:antitoxin component of MazEF toxin-antitoxin module